MKGNGFKSTILWWREINLIFHNLIIMSKVEVRLNMNWKDYWANYEIVDREWLELFLKNTLKTYDDNK